MPRTRKPRKEAQRVYLVRDIAGEVYGVFADEEDAALFANEVDGVASKPWVQPRILHYGQPPNRGYNE